MTTETGIPEGYKHTDVGVIPEDWEVKAMNEISDVRDGTHDSPKYVRDGVLFITSENIKEGRIDLSNIKYIAEKDAENVNKRSKVDKGDILMSMIGTIGNSVLIDFEPNFCIKNVALIKPKKIYAKFLIQLLYSQYYQEFIKGKLYGGIQKFISLSVLRNIQVPFPPLSEQKAIAGVLSDMDALLGSLEQLINKKKAVKQGTMQRLLSGQTRLPGFSGDWEVKKLGEIGEFKNGINKGKEDFGTGYPFVNLLDVFGVTKIFQSTELGLINSSPYERNLYELRKGDVLFVRSSVKPEGVGLTSVIYDNLDDTVFSGFLIRFRDFGKLNLEFKVHCFYEEEFRKRVIDNSTVSANTNINQESLKKIQILLPPLPEQQAIAEILSDMDQEIEGLERKRDKYKVLKQGMMQELLTGKRRIKG